VEGEYRHLLHELVVLEDGTNVIVGHHGLDGNHQLDVTQPFFFMRVSIDTLD
jgi:hypothetical protein